MTVDDELAQLRKENDYLRAALAHSDQPCAYCTLPAEKWGECQSGFPGCARADDAMGCPHFGAQMALEEMREALKPLARELLSTEPGFHSTRVFSLEARDENIRRARALAGNLDA